MYKQNHFKTRLLIRTRFLECPNLYSILYTIYTQCYTRNCNVLVSVCVLKKYSIFYNSHLGVDVYNTSLTSLKCGDLRLVLALDIDYLINLALITAHKSELVSLESGILGKAPQFEEKLYGLKYIYLDVNHQMIQNIQKMKMRKHSTNIALKGIHNCYKIS